MQIGVHPTENQQTMERARGPELTVGEANLPGTAKRLGKSTQGL